MEKLFVKVPIITKAGMYCHISCRWRLGSMCDLFEKHLKYEKLGYSEVSIRCNDCMMSQVANGIKKNEYKKRFY